MKFHAFRILRLLMTKMSIFKLQRVFAYDTMIHVGNRNTQEVYRNISCPYKSIGRIRSTVIHSRLFYIHSIFLYPVLLIIFASFRGLIHVPLHPLGWPQFAGMRHQHSWLCRSGVKAYGHGSILGGLILGPRHSLETLGFRNLHPCLKQCAQSIR
jgi:hypothetical protein